MKHAAHSRIPGFLSHLLYFFSIFVFIIAFGFQHNPPAGWYQQFLPDLNGRRLTDITFLDSLTGFAVTDGNASNNGHILKTTNGGDNWSIIFSQNVRFNKVQFVNSTTGFVNAYVDLLFKTTNAGENWFTINLPSELFSDDMWALNEDTIWLAQSEALVGGLFRSTNAGQTWIRQYYAFGNNPHRIYMFNGRMGFMYNEKDSLFKTTNSGSNWFRVPGGAFTDIYFIDTLTGWKARGDMKKTTDGGLSWITQQIPPVGGIIITSSMIEFSHANNEVIWGVGGQVFYGPGRFSGMIYKSTNQGVTWGYQIPDTMTTLSAIYRFCDFVDESKGYAYSSTNLSFRGGVHTKTGGNDTTFFTSVGSNNHSVLPNRFALFQNYPNPFNPGTTIRYELLVTSSVELRVFDIWGRETRELVNKKQNAGEYNIDFDASELPSGVYFYSLSVNGETIDTKKMVLIR